MPFESLGAVSYSPSAGSMAVPVAVRGIFSVKKRCDLEKRVRVRSRSLEMAPSDRSHTSSYSPFIITINVKNFQFKSKCKNHRPSCDHISKTAKINLIRLW